MPLTRFQLSAIADDGITSQKLAHDLDFDGQFVRVPHGTTAQRPSSPAAGYMRFNTTLGTLEQYNTNTNAWAAIDSPPVISSIAYSGSNTASDPAGGETITVTGSNFKSGVSITIGGTSAASVSFISSSSITFVTPAKAAGDYDVNLTNPNGLQATLINGISFNGIPTWTTSAGSLGTLEPSVAMSTLTIVASEPDSGSIGYSVTTGSLPAGLSLGSSNGQITGTPTAPSSTTTTNFTVTATDDESQTTPRAFSLQVLRPIHAYSVTNSMVNEKVIESYLSKTPSSAGNRRKWTFSTWVKLSTPPISGYFPRLFSAGTGAGSQTEIALTQTGQIRVEDRVSGTLSALHDSEMTVHDCTSWGHLVVQVDIANSTQAERTKVYWNGVQITRWASQTMYSNTSAESYVNATNTHRIGESATYPGNRLGGYLAETHFVDGYVVAPTVFGEDYNDTWVPKQVTGVTYGTNGFYMNYQDGNSLGNDVSGGNNDYAETGTQSQSVDTPSNNFPTVNMNFTQTAGIDQKEGGLFPYKNSNRFLVGTTASASKDVGGKYYCEVQIVSLTAAGGGLAIGFVPNGSIPHPDTDGDMQYTGGWRARVCTGNNASSWVIQGGSSATYATNVFSIGDWVGIGLDLDNDKFQIWSQNGTLRLDGDISSRVGKETSYVLAFGAESGGQSQQGRLNFGATAFQRTGGLPSGYQTFKASSYPTLSLNPLTNDGPQKHFKTLTYTGNGSNSRSITGQGFKPDIVWAKIISPNTYQHMFFTSPMGPNKVGHTQSSAAFDTNFQYGYLTSFDSDGYTVQAGSTGIENLNENNSSYVSWGWKCGGAPTATNTNSIGAAPTSGSVMIDGVASTSNVAGTLLTKKLTANTKSGVSTSIYVGNGGSSGSFAHGLGKAPRFVLHKRINSADSWMAHWHVGTGKFSVAMDNSGTVSSDATYGTHTNEVVSLVASTGARNTNGEEHLAMCFAEVPGFSSIGQYYGTGDLGERGPFVECGFRPAMVIFKTAAAGQWWVIHDSARDFGHNRIDHRIFPNDSAVQDTNGELEFHATGFKFYAGAENINNTYTYYVAFADQPKLFSNAALQNI